MADENRKLAAIMSADVVGYSRLMAADEAATVKTLKEYRALIAGVVERHKGRVVNAPGDNMLSEFPSAVEAVEAAYEIQQVLKGRNLERPAEGRMDFRIGLNLGDVIEEDDGTIYGDGVNIAARMEALADTGGICISNTIFEAVEGKLDFGFDFLGAQQVKNIDRPINVYRVLSAADAAKARQAKTPSRHLPVPVVVGVAAVLIVLVGIGGWWFASREDAPQMVTADGSTTDDPTLAMPTGPAIAVLPFENLSDNSDQNYFAVGLTEDVINRLSEFPRFHVLGRNSTTQYDDKSTDIRKISAELGARYLIQGGVRKADTEVRVTVQLLRGADGTQIWANTYDRSLSASNLFEIMDEITAQIASTIASDSGIITRTELKNIRGKPPATLEAYECELRLNAYYDV